MEDNTDTVLMETVYEYVDSIQLAENRVIPNLTNSRTNWPTNQPTNQPTNYMEKSPSWEPYSHTAGQIPCLLRNPKVYYRVHNSPPLDPILSHTNPDHNFPRYFPM